MTRYVLILVLLLTSTTSLCWAQDTATGGNSKSQSEEQPKVSAEKLKLSEEAFKLAGIDNELKQIAAKQVEAMAFSRYMSTMATAGSKAEADRRNRKTAALQQVFEKDIDLVDEMKSILIMSFAVNFTEDELNDMIEFYKTPAGVKMVKSSPKMADIVFKRTLSDVTPKLKTALEAAVKEEVLDKQKQEKSAEKN